MTGTEFITPIKPWGGIEGLREARGGNGENSIFQDVFMNAIQAAKDSEKNLQQKQYLLATGQIDDPHTVQIAASEAQLNINMLVQLRNKALDAYNELMRISL